MANHSNTGSAANRRFARSVLAVAVGLAVCAPVFADSISGFRLVMDDVISSRHDQLIADNDEDNRLALEELIQSDPDPVFAALQQKYEALPPFTQAHEESAEAHIAEASAIQKAVDGLWSIAEEASGLVADVKTRVRYDKRDEQGDHTTTLATVNPGFQYQVQRRKWQLQADYDYVRGQYFMDRDDPTNDHTVDLSWTYRPIRGRELSLSTLYARTSDRRNHDPIEDFDSALDPAGSYNSRRELDLRYKHGTLRDRTRFELYTSTETVDYNSIDIYDYGLHRNAIGGSFTWQMRRQLALVGEMRYLDFDYDNSQRDFSTTRMMAGADVILGRRLRAKLRAGYDSVDARTREKDGFVWEGMVEWALRRRSFLKLETGREIFEHGPFYALDTGEADVVRQDWVRTSWRERWTQRLSTEASFTHRRLDGSARDEDANQFMITTNYQLTDKWRFGVDAAYTESDRTFQDDYSRQTLTFRADYSL